MHNVARTVINMINEGFCLAVKVIGSCSRLFILIFSHCLFLTCMEINFSFPQCYIPSCQVEQLSTEHLMQLLIVASQ